VAPNYTRPENAGELGKGEAHSKREKKKDRKTAIKHPVLILEKKKTAVLLLTNDTTA